MWCHPKIKTAQSAWGEERRGVGVRGAGKGGEGQGKGRGRGRGLLLHVKKSKSTYKQTKIKNTKKAWLKKP